MPYQTGPRRPRLKIGVASTPLKVARSALNAAAAVDGDDLTGDVRRIFRQKQGSARDVLRGAVTLERGLVDDFALKRIVHVALGPEHRPRCDAVDADFRSELARQRPGQHRESGLGRAVYRVRLERAQ